MSLSVKKVLKFALLPGIVPQLQELFATGFGHIAFFMAQIYGAVRLLPAGHPYLNPANQGRFGLRHVIAAAAGNLKFRRENLDQVIIFFLLLIGIVLLFLQFALLGLSFFMHRAHASGLPGISDLSDGLGGLVGASSPTMPTTFTGMFGTPNPSSDLAFILMDRVFGVPNVFNSCVAQNVPCLQYVSGNAVNAHAVAEGAFPWPYHIALQSVFGFYSDGLLVIAMIIVLYFIIAVAAETAQTGTPFGQRFSRVWAPLRLIVALGLLIPVANGFNAAQYIVLYAAKWGSGFATNGWLMFANTALPRSAGEVKIGSTDHMIATPNPPELTNLLEYNTVLQTCWAANKTMKTQPENIQAYFVGDSTNPAPRQIITPYTTYDDALQYYGDHDIRIVFGTCQMKNSLNDEDAPVDCSETDSMGESSSSWEPVYADQPGGVNPECGEIDMKAAFSNDPGAKAIQSAYFDMVNDLWQGSASTAQDDDPSPDTPTSAWMEDWGTQLVNNAQTSQAVPVSSIINASDVTAIHNAYDQQMATIVQAGVQAETDASNNNFYDNVEPLGWAGAAIWYNKIADMNGAIVTAAASLPTVAHYPQIMEEVQKAKAASNTASGGRTVYQPTLADNQPIAFKEENGAGLAQVLYNAYNLWTPEYPPPSGQPITDGIINILGLRGLYDMQKQPDVQPLAQLSMLGKTLVEHGIDAIALGGGGALAGGVASYFRYDASGALIQQLSTVLVQLSILAISAGFLLFYVVPFLPFLYFFFAISTWIKGIFEAMVGVPLWALAHIRIEGDTLPGPAAGSGYFMILEIFLRPILIVFGLLAAVIFFSAEVHVLQDIWTLVVTNLTGYNMAAATDATGGLSTTAPAPGQTGSITEFRGVIDQFFYTIIYAVVVYMLGSASFKLIFLVPNGIMRWLGQGGVRAFNDDGDKIAEGVTGKMQFGVQRLNQLSNSTVSSINTIGRQMRAAPKPPK